LEVSLRYGAPHSSQYFGGLVGCSLGKVSKHTTVMFYVKLKRTFQLFIWHNAQRKEDGNIKKNKND
jgi:hypothetical protein